MMFNFAISLFLHYKIHVSINNITPTASFLPFSYGYLNDLIRKKTSFKTFLKPLSAYCEKRMAHIFRHSAGGFAGCNILSEVYFTFENYDV